MTSVSIVFIQFLVTVIYHVYMQLREPLKKLKIRIAGQEDAENVNGPEHEEHEPLNEREDEL